MITTIPGIPGSENSTGTVMIGMRMLQYIGSRLNVAFGEATESGREPDALLPLRA